MSPITGADVTCRDCTHQPQKHHIIAAMDLSPIDILPGIFKEDSPHAARNRWVDGNNVRFFKRFAEKIGGYVQLSASGANLGGPARGAHVWRTLNGTAYLAFGTRRKLWLYDSNDDLFDITPIRASGSLNNPFTTTASSAVVTVAHTGHGESTGDTVIFSGASAVGGITINGAYEVTVLNTDSYTITHSAAASSGATGGGTVGYQYEISIGLDENTEPTESLAWGEGAWGEGPWGGSLPSLAGVIAFRIWTLDNWGEDLVATYWRGAMYQWDASSGPTTRAALIANAPTVNNGLFVSSDTRHLVAVGAHDGSAHDPLLTRWASQETLTTWSPLATNTAGDKRVEAGNDLVASRSTRYGQILLTDVSAHIMTYVGRPFFFGIKKVGDKCGVLSPHAAVAYNDMAYWMGRGRFFMFDGSVKELDCDLQDEVFDNLNLPQAFKISAGTVVKKHEIWWFYPSIGSLQNNRCIIYNVKDNIWYTSDFPRSAWLDENIFTSGPVAVDNAGMIFLQESGVNADSAPLPYFLQSGDAELGNGEREMHLRRIISDFDRLSGDHQIELLVKTEPRDPGRTKGPYSYGENTKAIPARGKGRSIAMRLSSDALDADFRLGEWRWDFSAHGRR